MKHLKFLFPVLLCTLLLGLSSCKETNADRLTYRKTYRGTIQTETYQISEQDGNLFIETGLSVLLTYDKENDRILLSPGGEYKRSKQPIKK